MSPLLRTATSLSLGLLALVVVLFTGLAPTTRAEPLPPPEPLPALAAITASAAATTTLDIDITAHGFSLPTLAITPGTVIRWTNQTSQPLEIQGTAIEDDAGNAVFLPLVIKGGVGSAAEPGGGEPGDAPAPNSDDQITAQAGGWQSGSIPPKGSFSRAFSQPGRYPYILTHASTLTGVIIVKPVSQPIFLFSLTPLSRTAPAGQPANYSYTLVGANGFTNAVSLRLAGLPPGVSSSFSANPVTPPGGGQLTLTTSPSTPAGLYALTVIAEEPGGLQQSAIVLLDVQALPPPDFLIGVSPSVQSVTRGQSVTYTVAVTAINGLTQPVTLAAGGLPSSAVVVWGSNPLNPSGQTTLSVTPSPSGPTGTFTLIITGSGTAVHTTTATLLVSAQPPVVQPDFSIGISPSTQTITRGLTVSYTVAITAINGLTQPVTLAAGGLPAGAAVAWGSNPLTPSGQTTLSVIPSPSGPTGTFTLVITGSAGTVHTTTATLLVNAQPPVAQPDFSIGGSPAGQSVTQGQSVTYTVQLTAVNGYNQPVTLTAQSLPSGAGAVFAPNPVIPPGQSMMTLTTANNTPTGTTSLVVLGDDGALVHAAGLSVTVAAATNPQPDLLVEAMQVTPTAPLPNQPVVISLTVHNQGTAAAGPFQVDWYADRATAPAPGDSGGAQWSVPGLAAGASAILTSSHIFTQAGSYQTWGQIDTLGAVAEADEANNVSGPQAISVVSQVQNVCGAISQDTTWQSGVVYVATCGVTVNSGVTLTVQPGTVVKFAGTSSYINVYGTLDVQGTTSQPVVFTSLKDDSYGGDTNGDGNASVPAKGDWEGIQVYSSGSANFDHAILQYGGNTGSSYDSILYVNQGSLSVSNSTIAYSAQYGVRAFGTSPIITSSQVISSNSYGLWLDAAGATLTPILQDNVFLNNGSYAINLDFSSSYLTGNAILSNNTGSGNQQDGIYIRGAITGTTVLPADNLPYVIDSDLTIPAGQSLQFEPGVVVKLVQRTTDIKVYGTLDAQGTSSQPIVFTSLKDDSYGGDTNGDGNASVPAKGDWEGIQVYSGGSANFDHAILQYGGNTGSSYDSILYVNQGSLSVSNSTIAYSAQYGVRAFGTSPIITSSQVISSNSYGLWLDAAGATLTPILQDNVFLNNGSYAINLDFSSSYLTGNAILSNNTGSGNQQDGIYIRGAITGTTILPADNLPYVIDSDLTIPAGQSLQFEPGVVVKLVQRTTDIKVYGTLDAQGTSSQPIVFTSLKDDSYGGDTNGDGSASVPAKGDWTGMQVYSTGSANFDHAILQYGGYTGSSYDTILYVDRGNLSVSNSTIAYSAQYGVRAFGTSPIITSSQVISSNSYGLWLDAAGATLTPILQDNVFLNNGSYAINLDFSSSYLTGNAILSNNTGSGNQQDGIYIRGAITGTTVLPADNLPYVIDSDLTIPAGQSLQFEPGVVVKLVQRTTDIKVYGTLDAQGTSSQPIVFTSLKDDSYGGDTNGDGSASVPAKGDWTGMQVYSTGSANFDHAILQYGGYTGSSYDTILYVDRGNLSVSNSTIAYSAQYGVRAFGTSPIITSSQVISSNSYGLWLDAAGATLTPILQDNVFLNNGSYAINLDFSSSYLTGNAILSNNTGSGNQQDGIYIRGAITGTTVLPADNLPYVIDSDLTIPAGQSLQFEPGVVVKLVQRTTDIKVYGTLDAQGTSSQPIVFTSLKDDSYGGDTNGDGSASVPAKGDWTGMQVYSTGSANFDHAILQYGGYTGSTNDTILYVNQGSLSVSNSTIAYSAQYGVRASSSTAGIIIQHSRIYSNDSYGVYNANTLTTINATNNWWGDDSGPAPYGSGNGINYTQTCTNNICTITYHVDANPWQGKIYAESHHNGSSIPYQVFEADPVNTATGNYAYQRTDLSIETRSLPLAFSRAYNSANPQPGPLGEGWTHSYNIFATENVTDATVIISYGDGRQDKFVLSNTVYIPPAGIFSTLTKPSSSFVLTHKDQTVYNFDSAGRLASMVDKNGNSTTLSFGSGGRLSSVTGPAGRSLSFTYDGQGRLSQVGGPLGRTVSYGYDANGDLTTVTDVMGMVTTFAYTGGHRLTTITDANAHSFINNVYNGEGKVIEQRDALGNLTSFSYDTLNRQTTVTDPRGNSTLYSYDAQLRLINQKDALNQTISYSYDSDNNRTSVTDKRGNTTSYSYDTRGNVTGVTDALGNSSSMSYDTSAGRNNLTSQQDALGRITTYSYDASSNLIRITDPAGNVSQFSYNSNGQLTAATDGRGNVTGYSYDSNGYQSGATDALGQSNSASYDAGGRMLSETDALGRTTSYTYDAANRLLSSSQPLGKATTTAYDNVGNRTSITDPLGGVTTFSYDAKDRLVSTTDPLGNVTSYSYDAVDNQTGVTDALGHTTSYSYDALNRRSGVTDALGNTTTTQYDANGNRTRLTDANGQATQYSYDALNRLVSVTDAAAGTVSYSYDAVGNRTGMTDANGHTTGYSYTSLDQLSSETDPLGNVTGYGYDANGNRTSKTKADGTVISYSYDALDRLTGTSSVGLSISYSYDAVGNRSQLSDATGATSYSYDALDRLTQVSAPTGTLSYGYDLNDNRLTTTYPGGGSVTHSYDAANQLISVTDWQSGTTSYSYDAAGRQTGIQYANGSQASYSYDSADRLLAMQHTSPVSGTMAVFTYTLDAVGNRLAMQDLDGTTSYSYDALYRLTSVTYPGSETVSYSYDPMGNRLSMNSTIKGTTVYTYNAADRLLAYSGPGGTVAQSWDANGNLLTKGSASYSFDALDRLVQVISGTSTVQFSYNGDGVRVGKTINGVTTDYVQDVAAPLPIVLVETSAGQSSQYVYGNDLLAQFDPAGSPSYYHPDGLGSTRALSNQAGQRTDAYSYDVFGQLRTHTGSSGQSFTFAGEQMDDAIGLQFLRARYYDPEVGRFVSRDKFYGYRTSIQSLNRFVYAHNNPVRLIDLTGFSSKDSTSLDLFDTNPVLKPFKSISRLELFHEATSSVYQSLAKVLILEMARTRPEFTSLWPYYKARHTLDNIGHIGDFVTFASHWKDSASRAWNGELNTGDGWGTAELIAGEIFALSANTVNDAITGPGRALSTLIYGEEAVRDTPIVAQLDQDITGPQVIENIEGIFELGPRRYFGCAWTALSGGVCQ